MKTILSFTAMLVLAAAFVSAPLHAQPVELPELALQDPPPTQFPQEPQSGPQGRGGQMGMGNPQIRKQLEQIKIWQMTKEMNLPTEKAEKFFPLYNHYNQQMKTITDERRSTVRSLDSAVDNRAGEKEISSTIARVLKLDDDLAATHVKFIRALDGILSPIEVAKYMVFEQRFDREIRERIRMMMMERRMPPRGR